MGNIIKAGSKVSGKVEYVNLPFNKDLYYIETSDVNDIPSEYFNTYKMAQYYYDQSKYDVSVSAGSVISELPLKLEAEGPDGSIQPKRRIWIYSGYNYRAGRVFGLYAGIQAGRAMAQIGPIGARERLLAVLL